jgi:hypothetical protein
MLTGLAYEERQQRQPEEDHKDDGERHQAVDDYSLRIGFSALAVIDVFAANTFDVTQELWADQTTPPGELYLLWIRRSAFWTGDILIHRIISSRFPHREGHAGEALARARVNRGALYHYFPRLKRPLFLQKFLFPAWPPINLAQLTGSTRRLGFSIQYKGSASFVLS